MTLNSNVFSVAQFRKNYKIMMGSFHLCTARGGQLEVSSTIVLLKIHNHPKEVDRQQVQELIQGNTPSQDAQLANEATRQNRLKEPPCAGAVYVRTVATGLKGGGE